MVDEQRVGAELDLDKPNVARMYDYHLGGSVNFAIDRATASRIEQLLPDMPYAVRCNRAFLRRVVWWLVSVAGIDQILDLGSGVPTVGNVHEVAHEVNPEVRVAYVDFEPIAVHHARQLLAGENLVTVTQADIREPGRVLGAPSVSDLLDFTRPVAVLALGVLQFIPDEPENVIAAYRDATVPGSYAAISHLSRTSFTDEQMRTFLDEIMPNSPTPDVERSPAEIARLLPGYTLVPPGIVPVPEWWLDQPPTRDEVHRSNCYGGVGKKEH